MRLHENQFDPPKTEVSSTSQRRVSVWAPYRLTSCLSALVVGGLATFVHWRAGGFGAAMVLAIPMFVIPQLALVTVFIVWLMRRLFGVGVDARIAGHFVAAWLGCFGGFFVWLFLGIVFRLPAGD